MMQSGRLMYAVAHMWLLGDNFVKLVLSFLLYVGSKDQAQVIWLERQAFLYSETSHWRFFSHPAVLLFCLVIISCSVQSFLLGWYQKELWFWTLNLKSLQLGSSTLLLVGNYNQHVLPVKKKKKKKSLCKFLWCKKFMLWELNSWEAFWHIAGFGSISLQKVLERLEKWLSDGKRSGDYGGWGKCLKPSLFSF